MNAAAFAIACIAAPLVDGNMHQDVRQEFISHYKKIAGGMTKAAVRKLLGEPDGLVTRSGQFILGHGRGEAVDAWLYGSQGPGTLPTLGFVCFDKTGVSCGPWIYRTKEPPDQNVVTEAELRTAMRLFWSSTRHDPVPTIHDPLQVIRIVNALQKLGQAKSLAVLKEYSQIGAPSELAANPELLYAAKITFGTSAFFHPRGNRDGKWAEVSDQNMPTPWYPYVVIEDVPLFAPAIRPIIEYVHSGPEFSIWDELSSFEKSTHFIKRPLRPPDDPSQLLDRLRLLAPWAYHEPKFGSGFGRPIFNAPGQIVKLVRTAIKLEEHVVPTDLNGKQLEPKVVKALRETKLRWDSGRCEYVPVDK